MLKFKTVIESRLPWLRYSTARRAVCSSSLVSPLRITAHTKTKTNLRRARIVDLLLLVIHFFLLTYFFFVLFFVFINPLFTLQPCRALETSQLLSSPAAVPLLAPIRQAAFSALWSLLTRSRMPALKHIREQTHPSLRDMAVPQM